jgi:hypothetical protein
MPLPALAALGAPGVLGGLSAGGSLLTTLLGAKGAKDQQKLGEQVFDKAKKTYRQQRDFTRQTRRDQIDISKDVYERGQDRTGQARDRNLDLARNLRDSGREGFKNARDQNIDTLNGGLSRGRERVGGTVDRGMQRVGGTVDRGMRRIGNTVDSNIDTLRGARGRAVGRLDPYADRGNNAMDAYAFNLGVGNKPDGYTGLEHSAGAKFQLEQGRKQVEGGATGAGGLYSGETLAELERLRNGNVLSDRDNQMAQLFGMGGQGLQASGQIADIEGQYGRDVSGQRQWGTQNKGALDVWGTESKGGLDTWGTQNKNALDQFYRPQIADQRSQYATNRYNTDTNFANMGTQANNQFADRSMGLDQGYFGNRFNIDTTRSTLLNGAAGPMMGGAANGAQIAGQGAMMGGQMLQNGINSAINNGVYTYTQQGGTNPFAPTPAPPANSYQPPQPFTGGGGAGMSQRPY